MKVHESSVKYSEETVPYILHEQFRMGELYAKWVPHLISVDQKQNSKRTSQQCLTLLKRGPPFEVTTNWKKKGGGSAQKKMESITSAGKVIASILWDAKGFLSIEYVKNGITMTR